MVIGITIELYLLLLYDSLCYLVEATYYWFGVVEWDVNDKWFNSDMKSVWVKWDMSQVEKCLQSEV